MKLALTLAGGVPLYRQVEDRLAELIRSGQLPPGAPLPSVRQLAIDNLVSVITTRKAYEELETAGLVVSLQGRGTFVADHAADAARLQLKNELLCELRGAARRARGLGLDAAEILDAVRAALEEG